MVFVISILRIYLWWEKVTFTTGKKIEIGPALKSTEHFFNNCVLNTYFFLKHDFNIYAKIHVFKLFKNKAVNFKNYFVTAGHISS